MERNRRYDSQRRFNGKQKLEMAERQLYTCYGCGQSFWRQPLSSVQAHHIYPFSHMNGVTDVDNGVLLCPECHQKVDQMTIKGHIWPGNYTERDAEPEQKRKR